MNRPTLLMDVDSIFCIRKWINNTIFSIPSLLGNNSPTTKKDFLNLTAPIFIDNYPGEKLFTKYTDRNLLDELVGISSIFDMPTVENSIESIKLIFDNRILPIISLPVGETGNKLEVLCKTKEISCSVIRYFNPRYKFPDYLLSQSIAIIDDSDSMINSIAKGFHNHLFLISMPWNSKSTSPYLIGGWKEILNRLSI